jgi:hypothetical protein
MGTSYIPRTVLGINPNEGMNLGMTNTMERPVLSPHTSTLNTVKMEP